MENLTEKQKDLLLQALNLLKLVIPSVNTGMEDYYEKEVNQIKELENKLNNSHKL